MLNLFKITIDAFHLNYPVEAAIDIALFWNERYCKPAHSQDYIIRKTRANYAQFTREVSHG